MYQMRQYIPAGPNSTTRTTRSVGTRMPRFAFPQRLGRALESSAIIHSRLSVSNEASYKMNVFENVFCIFRATCTKVIPGCISP